MSTGGVTQLYRANAQQLFIPASNNKLFTTSAILSLLGSSAQFTTPVQFCPVANVSKSPTVCIEGMGDMSITSAQVAVVASRIKSSLQPSQHSVILVMDDSRFPGFPDGFPDAWEWGDLSQDYGALPGAFVVDENTFTVSVSASAVNSSVIITFNPAAVADYLSLRTTVVPSKIPSDVDVYYAVEDSRTLIISGTVEIGAAPVTYTLATLAPTTHFAAVLKRALAAINVTVESTTNAACQKTAPTLVRLNPR